MPAIMDEKVPEFCRMELRFDVGVNRMSIPCEYAMPHTS